MKINPVMTIIALLFAALVAYALYAFCHAEDTTLRWMITGLGGVSIFLSWAGTLAVSLPERNRNINFKVLCGLCASIITILQIVFTFSAVTMPTYTLISGSVLLIWLAIAYAIAK